jgi:rhodanese-related sulfurtransferase/glyoxylase-like metal-dependent hydrolase (beta-lactamase superfamily II)
MDVIPFVHEGLGNSSYLVPLGDGALAAVDPGRSIEKYLRAAEQRKLRIAALFETHLHADFVTGSLDLAAATGAPLFAPAAGGVRFPHTPLKPGEEVGLDGVAVEPIGSPGHTPEHLSYVFRWADRRPAALFSGGSLIVGGAARTDLISPEMTHELTRAQYRTLRSAFNGLPDETLLYPTHGGGSFCSSGAGKERTSTLGQERATNPLLRFDDEDEFASWFPETFPATPAYFAHMRAINQAGPRRRSEIAQPRPLAATRFKAAAEKALIVDTRPVAEYLAGHIPGSLSNAFRPSFATWLGWVVPLGTPLLLVTNGTRLDEIVSECLLVGHENLVGWLDGGIEAWSEARLPLQATAALAPEAVNDAIGEGALALDVREPREYEAGHIEGALHVPLGALTQQLDRVPRGRPLLTYCGIGERSATAASLLERAGFGPLINLDGGFQAWKRAGEKVAV